MCGAATHVVGTSIYTSSRGCWSSGQRPNPRLPSILAVTQCVVLPLQRLSQPLEAPAMQQLIVLRSFDGALTLRAVARGGCASHCTSSQPASCDALVLVLGSRLVGSSLVLSRCTAIQSCICSYAHVLTHTRHAHRLLLRCAAWMHLCLPHVLAASE